MKRENIEKAVELNKILEGLESKVKFLEYFKSKSASLDGIKHTHKIEISFKGNDKGGARKFQVESNILIDSMIQVEILRLYKSKIQELKSKIEEL